MAGETVSDIMESYGIGLPWNQKADLHAKLDKLHKDDLIEFLVSTKGDVPQESAE